MSITALTREQLRALWNTASLALAKTWGDKVTAGMPTLRTVTVLETSLTGTSQVVNIGAALPAGAIVLARDLVVNTQFAGQSDLTVTIGGTDADGIVASTDLDALGAGTYQGTSGANPTGGSYAGQQLTATFAATALASLSAGSLTINIWFTVVP